MKWFGVLMIATVLTDLVSAQPISCECDSDCSVEMLQYAITDI